MSPTSVTMDVAPANSTVQQSQSSVSAGSSRPDVAFAAHLRQAGQEPADHTDSSDTEDGQAPANAVRSSGAKHPATTGPADGKSGAVDDTSAATATAGPDAALQALLAAAAGVATGATVTAATPTASAAGSGDPKATPTTATDRPEAAAALAAATVKVGAVALTAQTTTSAAPAVTATDGSVAGIVGGHQGKRGVGVGAMDSRPRVSIAPATAAGGVAERSKVTAVADPTPAVASAATGSTGDLAAALAAATVGVATGATATTTSTSSAATGMAAVAVAAAGTGTTAELPNATQPGVAGQLAASLQTLRGRDDGVHVLTVRLHPDDLGPVRIVARLTGSDVSLHFTASSVAAATAVTEAGPRLHSALADGGLHATGVTVDHDTDLSGQQFGQGAGSAAADARTGGRDGRDGTTQRRQQSDGSSTTRMRGATAIEAGTATAGRATRHPQARSLDVHV